LLYGLKNPPAESTVETKLLPQFASSDAGGFALLAFRFIEHIEATKGTLRDYYGGGRTIDRGGRQNHDEMFFGGAKTRFVTEAFDHFESYHAGRATSTGGGEFHNFVHLAYEYATDHPDVEEAALSHRLRELIAPLRKFRTAGIKRGLLEAKRSEAKGNATG